MADISTTFGALLLGGLFASLLSGLVSVQVVMYFKTYPSDRRRLKSLVLSIWFLDTFHTCMIWSALWCYLVRNYGDLYYIDHINWNIALTVVVTAILTFLVHCFFAFRIHRLSKRNWFLTIPLVALAALRLVSAAVTTGAMIRLHSFSRFKEEIRWIFTLGLALSTVVDVLITGSLFVLLQTSRKKAGNLNAVIDSLILYAFETGSLTCAGTVVSMICWLTMPHNLIFMGLHFGIGKLYANSLLVTLNTRENVRRARSQSSMSGVPVHYLDTRRRTGQDDNNPFVAPSERPKSEFFTKSSSTQKLEINVERSVQYDID
ncbi:hypothetical protein BDQ17DRAFT_1366039 [Cyathus striatus]|nr:hypothetical protein BDQ17DRAFT_1366039 [Cyathus striatus]